ncbi:MAG: 5'-nucleotidase [Campylobacterales bacterium]|nr:5'-nucleotidase [Campylobacterales bacterium]
MKLSIAIATGLLNVEDRQASHLSLATLLGNLQMLSVSGDGFNLELYLLSNQDFYQAEIVLERLREAKIQIARAIFIGSDGLAACLSAFEIDLFLASDKHACMMAEGICASAIVLPRSLKDKEVHQWRIRFAFDADAVLFDKQTERLFQTLGRDAFFEHEAAHSAIELPQGPFAALYQKLCRLKTRLAKSEEIQIAIITARGIPAERRVMHTLRSWECIPDALFFLDGSEKYKALCAYDVDIFFDDKLHNLPSDKTDAVLGYVVS